MTVHLEYDGVDLERCPFCLQEDALIVFEDELPHGSGEFKHLICCGSCGARGPWAPTAIGAATLWNAGKSRPSILNGDDQFKTQAEGRAYAMGLQHGKFLPK